MMQTTTINVLINGESRKVPRNYCVSALLDLLDVTSDRVAVELNRSLVRKREWATTPVTEGAQIEIVEFVGGG